MVCRVGWLAGTGASALGLVGGLVARIGLVSSTPTFVPVDGLGRPGGFGRLVAAVRIEAAAARCRPFVGIAARVRIILRPRAAARSTLGYGFAVVLRRGRACRERVRAGRWADRRPPSSSESPVISELSFLAMLSNRAVPRYHLTSPISSTPAAVPSISGKRSMSE